MEKSEQGTVPCLSPHKGRQQALKSPAEPSLAPGRSSWLHKLYFRRWVLRDLTILWILVRYGRTKCFLDSHKGPWDLRKFKLRVEEAQQWSECNWDWDWVEFEYPHIDNQGHIWLDSRGNRRRQLKTKYFLLVLVTNPVIVGECLNWLSLNFILPGDMGLKIDKVIQKNSSASDLWVDIYISSTGLTWWTRPSSWDQHLGEKWTRRQESPAGDWAT